jgi:hypothetical protein
MVVNTAELFFHDIIVMREMLGLDMMYNSDKLNAMNDKICHSAGKVLQSQDFRDTNTEIQTTDFGISKKKENN